MSFLYLYMTFLNLLIVVFLRDFQYMILFLCFIIYLYSFLGNISFFLCFLRFSFISQVLRDLIFMCCSVIFLIYSPQSSLTGFLALQFSSTKKYPKHCFAGSPFQNSKYTWLVDSLLSHRSQNLSFFLPLFSLCFIV